MNATTPILPALFLALASPAVYADGLATQVAGALKAGKDTWLSWSVPSRSTTTSGSRQTGQSLRTNRWAMTTRSVAGSRKGSTPRSIRSWRPPRMRLS